MKCPPPSTLACQLLWPLCKYILEILWMYTPVMSRRQLSHTGILVLRFFNVILKTMKTSPPPANGLCQTVGIALISLCPVNSSFTLFNSQRADEDSDLTLTVQGGAGRWRPITTTVRVAMDNGTQTAVTENSWL